MARVGGLEVLYDLGNEEEEEIVIDVAESMLELVKDGS